MQDFRVSMVFEYDIPGSAGEGTYEERVTEWYAAENEAHACFMAGSHFTNMLVQNTMAGYDTATPRVTSVRAVIETN